MRPIYLRLHSNFDRYKIALSRRGGSEIINVNNKQDCVRILADEERLRLVAIPLSGEYYNKVFIKTELNGSYCIDLYFRFLKRNRDNEALNIFYLTDENYGLKIDGTLFFKAV